nr:phosphoribosyltransferase [Chthonobacter albigriseus]
MPIEPHHFWQEILPPAPSRAPGMHGYSDAFPAVLPDGSRLMLPIRVLPGAGDRAVASLIVNQASFAVEDALAAAMTALARPFEADVLVGVPTLGLPLAANVARRLGHGRMVPLGTSRKFWYRDDLSEPLRSITTPDQAKRIFLDPRMLPLIIGQRVLVIDDVLSSGASMASVLRLLARAGVVPVGIVAAMLQTERWVAATDAVSPGVSGRVRGAIRSPLLARGPDDLWHPADDQT